VKFLEEVRRRLPEYPPYYEAPVGNLLRLDQNANLAGPNPVVRDAKLDMSRAHLYPTRDNTALLDAAAKAFRTDASNVFVGNGSDEILDIVLRTLAAPGQRVVSPHPSYSMYPHLCRLSRLEYVPVRMDAEFRTTSEAILAARPDLVLIANPNNPTGTILDPRIIGQVLDKFDGPVLLDEAYGEFTGASLIPLLDRYPNLVVSRTLSKAAGLAGLRVGLGFAHRDVAELIRRNKIPFSLNILSEQLAVTALQHPKHIEATVTKVSAERERLAKELAGLGFSVVPSHANFVLTLPPIPSDELYAQLRSAGILTRLFSSEPALKDYIRFTVGRREDSDRLLAALRKILEADE
jgi:histidinol-phosphate aminotransferase